LELTKEQEAAILTRGNNVLVSAAAGSGKTFVLVERVMEMICNEELDEKGKPKAIDIDRLLVVTFTDAAATEMRRRISKELAERLSKHPNNELLQRQFALSNRSSIMTIHAFCLSMIRRFFHVLEIDPGFRVADTTEIDLLKAETIDEVFEKNYRSFYENGENSAFIHALRHFSDRIDDWAFKGLILKIFDFAWSFPNPMGWLQEQVKNYELKDGINGSIWYKFFREHMKDVFNNVLKNMQDIHKLALNPNIPEKHREITAMNIEQIYGVLDSLTEKKSLQDFYAAMDFDPGRLTSAKSKTLDGKMDEAQIKALREKISTERTKTFTDVIKQVRERALVKSPVAMEEDLRRSHEVVTELARLVSQFAQEFAAAKAERNIMDFSDFEHFCLKIMVKENEKGEWIPNELANEVAGLYDEIFIDEYQDSSLIQEIILNAVAGRKIGAKNRFMVGDIKQSIYRFRLARPEIFIDKLVQYKNPENPEGQLITLAENFRSRNNVIDGINFLMSQLMSGGAGDVDYDEDVRLRYASKFEGTDATCILHIVDKAGGGEEYDNPESTENTIEELARAEVEAKIAAEYVQKLIKAGFMVREKGESGYTYRRVRYSDIVILLRAKSHAQIFADELKNLDIPAFSGGDDDYFAATEVLTMLALLQIIDNPLQDTPLISVMYSPIFRFIADELVEIRHFNSESRNEKMDFYERVINYSENGTDEKLRSKINNFLEKLEKWRDLSVILPISQLILELYENTGFFNYVGLLLGGNIRQANLNLLFEKAADFERTSYMGLFNFIRYIEKLQRGNFGLATAAVFSENSDLVRIMTIHKSKGLEFPIVLLCDCGKALNLRDARGAFLMHWDLGFGFSSLDLDLGISSPTFARYAVSKRIEAESLSEELRVLYVALTRAKEKLILIGTVSNLEKKSDKLSKIAMRNNLVIPAYDVLGGRSFLDWILMGMMRHKNFEDILKSYDISANILKDNSNWEIAITNPNEITKNTRQKKEIFGRLVEVLENLDLHHDHSGKRDEISRRLNYRYPFEHGAVAPSKMSVSEVKRMYYREFSGGDSKNYFSQAAEFKMPEFVKVKAEITAAERGIIFHKVLEFLDFDSGDIPSLLQDLENRGILAEGDSKHVNIKKLQNFLKSDIAERLRRAKMIKREMRFAIGIEASQIDAELKNTKGDMILHGIVDCIFEEDDGNLVILDYKTDYVGDASDMVLKEIAERYRAQIILYKTAIERIFDKNVKEALLWFFAAGRALKLDV